MYGLRVSRDSSRSPVTEVVVIGYEVDRKAFGERVNPGNVGYLTLLSVRDYAGHNILVPRGGIMGKI